jgi:hypothetical protein
VARLIPRQTSDEAEVIFITLREATPVIESLRFETDGHCRQVVGNQLIAIWHRHCESHTGGKGCRRLTTVMNRAGRAAVTPEKIAKFNKSLVYQGFFVL